MANFQNENPIYLFILQYAHFMANKVGSTSTDEAQILDQLVEDKPLPITTLVDDYDRFVYFLISYVFIFVAI